MEECRPARISRRGLRRDGRFRVGGQVAGQVEWAFANGPLELKEGEARLKRYRGKSL